MFFILKISILVSLVMTTALVFLLWPHRKVLLSRLLILNMAFYSLWSIEVILTLLTDDVGLKIFFTKIRQITNAFIIPTWVSLATLLFHRSIWDKYRKVFYALYILPVMTSIASILCLFFNELEPYLYHSYKFVPEGQGLMLFEIGPLYKMHFSYGGLLLVPLYCMYIINLFSARKHARHFAALMMLGGLVSVLSEVFYRYLSLNTLALQFSAGSAGFLCLATYFGVTRMEFSNIKSFARQKILERLPNPVLAINPSLELWDTNHAARLLFQISDEDLGKSILDQDKFNFIFLTETNFKYQDKIFQIFQHELEGKGKVYVLSDVTELEESNMTLKVLNSEILRMSNFNKKVQTVLSHDMSGVLGSIQTLAQTEQDSPHMKKILKASESSIDLLKNILSWSYEEKNLKPTNLHMSLEKVLTQLGPQLLEKNMEVIVSRAKSEIHIQGSPYMIEAILRNILTNAIKFGAENSIIPLETSIVESMLEIKVTNTITHADIQVNKGYGIGLKFTEEFLDQLKGKLHLSSSPSEGTRVTIHFPLAVSDNLVL